MGARIGRGVWLETYWLPESDLVRLGDGATVNRGCVVQTHLFHDRIMSMDEVRSTTARRSGPHGIILPGASIGARTTIGPGSLVTRGDSVPAGHPLAGQPDHDLAAEPQAEPGGRRRPGPTTRTCPRTATAGTASSTTTWSSTTGWRPTGSPDGR